VWLPIGDGLTPTGTGLALRPRDLAKFGQLFLDSGMFRGRRILSAAWVQRSTSAHLTLRGGPRYGYLWWLPPDSALEGILLLRDAYYAHGFGDQFLYVLPNAGVVVVVTAENYAARRIDPDAFLTRELAPVIAGGR
jgi:CubicO group peptidase (beta-lactamase class C family)